MKKVEKIGDVVKLKQFHQGHLDKRGGDFELYLITKINRINVMAVNLATGMTFNLKKDHIVN
tara:strand:- start:744 stop:929 length:186 start_codon:yes stop_codon:yes gene_type:complete